VRQAFKAVKRNRGAAGIDKVSVKMFEANLDENLQALMRDLKAGTFQPHPLRRADVPKGKHEQRPLGIPAVRDRVGQEVIRRLLQAIFEPLFHDRSQGFRPLRNCHSAVRLVLELHRQGYTDVLDADVKGFFDNIPHGIILNAVASQVADGNILQLIEKLNQVIRGTAGYFATSFSHCNWQFRRLDQWIRMRLRCMRFKRKSRRDNYRLRLKHLRNLGLLNLADFC